MGFELQSAGHGKNTNVECKFITFEDKPGHNVKLRGYSEADWKKISIWDRIGARLSRNCFDVKVTKDGKEEKFVIVKDKFFKHSFSGEKTLPSSSQVCQMLTTASKGKIREDHTLERQDQQQGEAAKPPVGGQKPDGSRVVDDMPATGTAKPPEAPAQKVLEGATPAARFRFLVQHDQKRLQAAIDTKDHAPITALLNEIRYGNKHDSYAQKWDKGALTQFRKEVKDDEENFDALIENLGFRFDETENVVKAVRKK